MQCTTASRCLVAVILNKRKATQLGELVILVRTRLEVKFDSTSFSRSARFKAESRERLHNEFHRDTFEYGNVAIGKLRGAESFATAEFDLTSTVAHWHAGTRWDVKTPHNDLLLRSAVTAQYLLRAYKEASSQCVRHLAVASSLKQ